MARRRKGEEQEDGERFVVPHDTMTEQIVAASILVGTREERRKILQVVRPDTFLTPDLTAAVAAALDLDRQGLDLDFVALQRIAGDRIDVEYLAKLTESVPEVPPNIDWHVDCLLWDRQRATVATGPFSDLLKALRNPSEPPERVRALAKQVGYAFEGGHGAGRFLRDPTELAKSQALEIRQRLEGTAIYEYGIPGLDTFEEDAVDDEGQSTAGEPRWMPGSSPGSMTVLTAFSGEGKSTMALNMALGMGKTHRRKGLYCAWEPKSGETLEVLAAISLGMDRVRFKAGARARHPLTREELLAHEEEMHRLGKYIRFMDNPFRRQVDDKRASNSRNLDIVQEHIAAAGVSWVMFDLWERCLEDLEPQAMTKALWRQYAMGEELRFHSIVLAQQLIKGERVRADKRPTIEGIKGSASYVEVADTIIGCHRPGRWKPGLGDTILEAHGLKHRHGDPTVAVEHEWNGRRGTILGGKKIPPMSLVGGGEDVLDSSTMYTEIGRQRSAERQQSKRRPRGDD